MAKPKRYYAVFWTWMNFELVRTQAAGKEILKDWVRQKKKEGWHLSGNEDVGYFAASSEESPATEAASFRELTKEQFQHLQGISN